MVSILTHPEGRVRRRHGSPRWSLRPCFNPHPPRRAGATGRGYRRTADRAGFNPHPPRRAGATYPVPLPQLPDFLVSILTHPEGRVRQERLKSLEPEDIKVSILTHPEGRVRLPPGASGHIPRVLVSILTHPEGRVRRDYDRSMSLLRKFQSSPTPKGGCDINRERSEWRCQSRFNPHPPRRAGATRSVPRSVC